MTLQALGQGFLKTLPSKGVCWSCCYGSKVLESKISADSQLDVLVVVNEEALEQWHHLNLATNPKHYSFINRVLGSK